MIWTWITKYIKPIPSWYDAITPIAVFILSAIALITQNPPGETQEGITSFLSMLKELVWGPMGIAGLLAVGRSTWTALRQFLFEKKSASKLS